MILIILNMEGKRDSLKVAFDIGLKYITILYDFIVKRVPKRIKFCLS